MVLSDNREVADKCCRVETGALIYGIINVVIAGLGSICFLGLTTYVGIEMADLYKKEPLLPRRATENELALELVHLLIITPVILIALLFAVLLIVGVTKKRPALVLTYFIFGLLLTAVALVGAIAYQVALEDGIVAAVTFPIIVIYALPLIVVFMAFKKLRAAVMYAPNYNYIHS